MENRTIVMTGVTRGLGRALMDRFVEAGHTVIGCGRSLEAIGNLRTLHGSPHRFDMVDVASAEDVDSWAASLPAELQAPDLLINNAGIINRNARLWEVPAAEFDQVLKVNVGGTENMIRAFVPAMIRHGSGVVVNFSSGWGRSAAAEVGPYCASKWAVEGLTRSLALELPEGLGAVSVNPGVIDTSMLRSCWSDEASLYPTPEDWAPRAARMLLEVGPHHNGAALTL